MSQLSPATNPFALMLDPQSVLSRIERSERLARLQRRVCHPLDKLPLVPVPGAEVGQHDRSIDELYARIESEVTVAQAR